MCPHWGSIPDAASCQSHSLSVISPFDGMLGNRTLFLRLLAGDRVKSVEVNVSAGQGEAALAQGVDLVLWGLSADASSKSMWETNLKVLVDVFSMHDHNVAVVYGELEHLALVLGDLLLHAERHERGRAKGHGGDRGSKCAFAVVVVLGGVRGDQRQVIDAALTLMQSPSM